MTALVPPPYATKRVKSSNEILVYMNMGIGQITNKLVFADGEVRAARGAGDIETPPIGFSCGGENLCPIGHWEATVIQNKNKQSVGTLPVNSFLFAAVEGLLSPGGEGDIVNHVCLPNTDDDILVCFDQGVSTQPGVPFQPVPRKFSIVDHYILQRPENTLTLQNLFVSSWVGLQRFMGTPCTVIVAVNPDGTGAFQEVQYYCNALLSPQPMDSSEGSDPINISMTGTYDFCAIFGNTTGGDLVGP